jgi:hypothetical protein
MRLAIAVVAAAAVGVAGLCRAEGVGAPGDQMRKAVLYEEDQANPNGFQFVGSAVWRTEAEWRVVPGSGQKPDIVVVAYIGIPERNLSVRLALRRNDDKALPASHTVEVMFTVPADFAHGGIANVPGLLMKQGETTRGVPLSGVAVKVAANLFLIGLSSVEADRQRNVQLMKERLWIDVPIVYGDGGRAILAIEKAPPGGPALAVIELSASESVAKPQLAALPPSMLPVEPVHPKPGPAIVISGDRGGEMKNYFERYRSQATAGSTFRIDGRCASACTLVLGWADRVCVTRRAELGFHQVRDGRTGRVTAETRQTTERLLALYPAPVREYILAHGGLPDPAGMLWVSGAQLRGLVKACD